MFSLLDPDIAMPFIHLAEFASLIIDAVFTVDETSVAKIA
jgi:hypothetical protein